MNQKTIKLVLPILFAGAAAWAQTQPAGGQQNQNPPAPPQQGDNGTPAQPGRGFGPPPGQRGRGGGAPPPPRSNRPPLERSLPQGRWWNNPEMIQKLNLNSDQQKKMDDIFQQNRLRLVDLNANLQKEEITMEPMMAADAPDESKILAQIDKVAQARAELEKANARFLLGIRRVLTQEQWKKLQTETAHPDGGRGRGQGGPGGPPNPPPPARKGG
jgi:Spy/CpxP family protein refolding chaperone